MRVLVFYQYFTTPKGAWSTRVYEFARRWVRAGHQVTVVTSVYDKSDLQPRGIVDRVDVDGIDVRVINVKLSNKHGVVARLLSFAWYAAAACWYALVLPADVVVASSGPITVGLPGLAARWVRSRPLVFEVRDLWPEGAIQLGILRSRALILAARWFERRCYRAASVIVAASQGQARWIADRHPVDGKVVVIPNASDTGLAESVGAKNDLPEWARGKKLATYAGTLGLIDDCSQLVRAAALIDAQGRSDVMIVVIGDGKERQQVEALASERGVRSIRFLGLQSREEVFRWLAVSRCSLFVVKDTPFLATASPNKLFDAFAVGIPVVQTTDGWIGDLVERERCGLNVPQGDDRAFAAAILALADDDELHARLGAAAARLGRTRFNRDVLAAEMLAALERAADRSVARTRV